MGDKLAVFLEVVNDTNKTVVMLLLLILGGFFRWKGFIDGPGVVDLLKTVTVSYFATSTVTHFTEMLGTKLTSKGIPAAVVAEVEKTVENG